MADHVDLCYGKDIDVAIANPSIFEMTWRILPLLDDFIDIFVSITSLLVAKWMPLLNGKFGLLNVTY